MFISAAIHKTHSLAVS